MNTCIDSVDSLKKYAICLINKLIELIEFVQNFDSRNRVD